MEPDSWKSLGTLLIWGALFFLMMRYGCGAHMMGGHRHRGGYGGSGAMEKDPVCGMNVDPGKAAAAGVHGGRTWYFCSASCRDKFAGEPERYLAGQRDDQPHGGHHHG